MTIGLVILSAIGFVYLGASNVFRSLEASSRIQENVRFAFEQMAYDVRMAGGAGCSYSTQANVLNGGSGWQYDLFGFPLRGAESGQTPPTGVTGVVAGDLLTILRANNDREYVVDTHNPNSAQFQLTANHDLRQGEILVVTDCTHAAVFQMTNVNNNASVATVNHNTGNATAPGNCTKGFGLPVDCSDVNGVAYTFQRGSRIYRLQGVTYYLRLNADGERALYRQALGVSGGSATTGAEELVAGVEDMQILYGVDTTPTADGQVDSYVAANQVTAVAPGGTDAERWRRVLAVRVSLLTVSPGSQSVTTTPQAVVFNGATVQPTDRRLRKVFTTTIAVRNRL